MQPANADDPLRTAEQAPAGAIEATASFAPDGTADSQATGTYQPSDPASAGSERAPPSIPGYTIEAILGRGGMGIVYRAKHLALKRTVALKMILAGGHAGPREVARFRIEAEAVARLQHPNIVQIHEVGEADGHPYFALEYLDGGSLAKRLRGQPMTPLQAASLVEALARAMQLAHSRNVVHRDLKPANVLLAADGTPKVTDFGLARQLDDDSGQTQAGAVVGTPSYMAPEQAAGEAHAAGPAADVYALGAILYECLTGRPPHRGDSVAQTLEQVRTKEPDSPRQLKPGLPRDLETICLKCLHKEPERRYASAEALAEDLRRWVAGEPIAARPVGSVERAALWVRRKPARAGLAAALVLLAFAVLTFVIVIAVREHQVAEDLAKYNTSLIQAQGEKEAALKQALQESARIALGSGLTSCEAGDVGLGLIHLTRALDSAVKAKDDDLESAIRFNIAAWEWQLWSLHSYRDGPPGALVSSLGPRGAHLATLLANNTVELWDLADASQNPKSLSLPHGEPVKAHAFSGDGDFLLTRTDRTARIWSTATGRLAGPPLEHALNLTAAGLSRDGKWVLTGSGTPPLLPKDNVKYAVAQLWQTGTGHGVVTIPHSHRVAAVAFSPRGDRAATGDALGMVQLWQIPGGEGAGTTLIHKGGIQAVAFSPDAARIIVGTAAGFVHVWHVETGKPAFSPLSLPFGEIVVDVAFSPDGQRLLARTITGRAYLWRADTGFPIASPLAHHGRVESAAFSPDGRTLLTGGAGGLVQGWDTTRGQPVGPLLAHRDAVRDCLFSRDDQFFTTLDGAVRQWRRPPGIRRAPPMNHPGLVRVVTFCPDGKLLLTAGADGVARLWSTSSNPALGAGGHGTPRQLRHKAFINAAAFSPDSRLVLTAGIDHEPVLWDTVSGDRRAGLKGHTGFVYAITFSEDGKKAISGSKDGTARVWDIATARPRAVLRHKGSVEAVAFSPNDRHVLTGGADNTAGLWDLSTEPPTVKSLPHEGVVETVAFSSDGDTAITADVKDGAIRLWEPASGVLLRKLTGHGGGIKALAVSRDGQYLASGSHDRTARLWKLSSGESIGLPMAHQGTIRHVAFSPDGHSVYTASEDNTARRWHVPTGIPIGPAFVHDGTVQAVAVHPESGMAATGSRDQKAMLWNAPAARQGTPERLAHWAQLVTGMTLDESRATRVLTPAAWLEHRRAAR